MSFHPQQTTESNPVFIAEPNVYKPRFIFLTTVGDGTGSHNMNGNYASAATDAYFQAVTDFFIYSGVASISDSSKFVNANYGGLNSPLTNGVKIYYKPNGGSEQMMFNSSGIKANYDWIAITGNASLTSFDQTAQTLAINFDFVKMMGTPLHLAAGDKMIIRLNDDFTGLDHHSFAIAGREFI